ncbi:MAG: type II toxin-antitoxin system PemK/MazF family toxin [Terriglobia bacterium]
MAHTLPSGWFPRRGEVYLVHLDKDRPALVISADALNRYALDVCLVPLTTVERPRFSLRVQVKPGDGGLSRDSWAKCDQVTTLEKNLLLYTHRWAGSPTRRSKPSKKASSWRSSSLSADLPLRPTDPGGQPGRECRRTPKQASRTRAFSVRGFSVQQAQTAKSEVCTYRLLCRADSGAYNRSCEHNA